MSSKDRKSIPQQKQVFTAVEDSPVLLDMLEIATSSPRKAIFIDNLKKHLPAAFINYGNKSPEDLFNLFTTGFGEVPDYKTTFSRIDAAVQHRKKYFLEKRYKNRLFLRELGLDLTEARKRLFLSTVVISVYSSIVRSSFFSRFLRIIFPSSKHLILPDIPGL